MGLKWFDGAEAEKFGRELAQFFVSKIPSGTENSKNKALAKRLDAVDEMYLKIEKFKQSNSLNIYKKAKLGGAFKDELIAAGYDQELVERVTKGLLLKL